MVEVGRSLWRMLPRPPHFFLSLVGLFMLVRVLLMVVEESGLSDVRIDEISRQ